MTMHTYEVRIIVDLEAPNPIVASVEALARVMANAGRPIHPTISVEARQFVDTDVPPLVFDVDIDDHVATPISA